MCTRRIDPIEEAVRVINTKLCNNSGTLRYWLCWRCAGELDAAIAAMSKRTVAA